jgi:NAD(P)-dependent dehydrogenase (short-subunit alcohol dehydrogenase family)
MALVEIGLVVVLIGRTRGKIEDLAKRINTKEKMAHPIHADITDEVKIKQAVLRIENEIGPVDILVNNAGVAGPHGPTWEINTDEWKRCIEINLLGQFVCTYNLLPGMISRGRGRIINIVSSAGIQPFPFASAYSVGKTALIRFSEILACEVSKFGITVFALHPGRVHTSMIDKVQKKIDQNEWWSEEFSHEFLQQDEGDEDTIARMIKSIASGSADPLSGRFLCASDNLEDMLMSIEEINDKENLILRINHFKP